MLFAIVDIETTGGYAAAHDITEIAVVIHDGMHVVERFTTLVQPDRAIPHHIQVLTGITPAMVASAPRFEEVAPHVLSLLEDKIFVAHNVNFDYSFLKHHFESVGLSFKATKLCTVRLSRSAFPGLPSYSLGNLCRQFGIAIEGRHRAWGDAAATAKLFERIFHLEEGAHIQKALQKSARTMSLPVHLPQDALDPLPYTPGVYYFHDQKGKILYVGKAKNIRYRVRSHFSHNGTGKQRQDFLRNIYQITYATCASELMAFVVESLEIRKHWPPYNKSQKRFAATYGLIRFRDQNGYERLAIEKKRKTTPVVHSFFLLAEGHRMLRTMIHEQGLCPKLCFMQTDEGPCVGMEAATCKGACEKKESPKKYNAKVDKALQWLTSQLPSFSIIEKDHAEEGYVCFLMEEGRFYGMGRVDDPTKASNLTVLKPLLDVCEDLEIIRNYLLQFAEKYPERIIRYGSV